MRGLYRLLRLLCRMFFRLGRVCVQGAENIPDDKALLVICNHSSFCDPLVLAPLFPYQLTFIAKEQFGQNSLTRILFGMAGAVFLKKDESDLAAMRVVMRELNEQRAVAIFPEGKRHYDQRLGEFKPGASYIAQRSRVRVLPVALVNSGDFLHFWRRGVRVYIGKPIEAPPDGRPDKQLLEQYTALYREQVFALQQEGQAAALAQGRQIKTFKK